MARVKKSNLCNQENQATKGNFDDCIRKKAYELWEKKGRISGKDLEIWLEAEKIVKGCQK